MPLSIAAMTILLACAQTVPDSWIVKIGDSYITPKIIETGLQNLPLETRKQITQQNQQQIIQKVLNESVQKEIIYQEALAENIDTDEEFQKILTRLEKQYHFQRKQTYVDFLLRQKADQTIKIAKEEPMKLYNDNIKLFQAT